MARVVSAVPQGVYSAVSWVCQVPSHPVKRARLLVHFTVLDLPLGRQAEARLGPGESAGQEVGGIATDGRPVFEAVARAGAYQESVLPSRMAVDEQVAVRAVLVLAHARLHE